MAISSYKTFLMYKAGGASDYTKLIDIKEFPDLGGAPEMLETTTLSDFMQTYTEGIQSLDALEFPVNYTKETFKKINDLSGQELDLAVWFGGTGKGSSLTPTGDNGKFTLKGTLSIYVSGGGVNEVVEATVTVTPTTVISFAE